MRDTFVKVALSKKPAKSETRKAVPKAPNAIDKSEACFFEIV